MPYPLRGRFLSHRWALIVLAVGSAAVAVAPSRAAGLSWQEAIDYDKLSNRLGDATPVGSGGAISMVEAPTSSMAIPPNAYFIDVTNVEFDAASDPLLAPLAATDGSGGAGNGASGHATSLVGIPYFGNTGSTAPGANAVTIYEVNNWLSNVLHYNGMAAPEPQPFRVQNHSWIAPNLQTTEQDQSVLRRLDYLIETGDMTAVVGANNNSTPNVLLAHPRLLVQSYNAIVAGRTDGAHSRGQTNFVYGPGRYKPDIVAPASFTSTSTARVSSAVAMLHETAAGTDAARSETMKAILLAGATKSEFASFVDPTTGALNPWNRTATRPLDDVFGAGELNVYNSYLVQLGGRFAGSTSAPAAAVGAYGWDYQDRTSDASVGDIYYNIEIAPGSSANELSIMLAWNAKITDTSPGSNFTPVESLQNLDLELYDSTDSFLGALVDQSHSTVDNVEHIYQTDLGPGVYTLKVSGAANWDYGLAWRMATQFDVLSADFDDNGTVDGSDFLTWQRNQGRLLGASHADGDADGDGDVDANDLAAYEDGAIAPPQAIARTLALGVPEPASIASLAAGLALLGARTLLHKRPQKRG